MGNRLFKKHDPSTSSLPQDLPKTKRRYTIQAPSLKFSLSTTSPSQNVEHIDNVQLNNEPQDKFIRKGNRSISLIQKNKMGSNIFKEELKLKVTINTIIEENRGLPTMKYKLLYRLGDGAYGTVYLALNIKTKTKVAIKKIKKVKENEIDDVEIKNENDILKKLDHPNVVKIIEFYTNEN